jgi:CHRD domain
MARRTAFVLALAVAGAATLGVIASIGAADSGKRSFHANRMIATFEVPAVSSNAEGSFEATLESDDTLSYRLTYSGLESAVTQSHIHFAQKFASGGISVWLCETPAVQSPQASFDTPCPPSGTVTGTIVASNVIGPAGQGIAASEFSALLEAMREGLTYANVHSASIPGGEIRGQIRGGGDNGDDDD